MKLTCQIPAQIAVTGTLAGTTAVTGLSSTSGLTYGNIVQGTGIPADTLIQSITSATAITLNQAATVSGSQALTFYLEPVTLAAMKLQLRVDILDDDSLIAAYIAAARAYCEAALDRALLTSTWLMTLDHFPTGYAGHSLHAPVFWERLGSSGLYHSARGNIIHLPRPPLQSVTAVQYIDSTGTLQTLDPSNYTVSTGTPGRIEPSINSSWPVTARTLDAVQVTFVAGYGASAATLPPEVYGAVGNAIKLLVGHWYAHRAAVSENGVQFAQIPMTVDFCLAALDHGSYG